MKQTTLIKPQSTALNLGGKANNLLLLEELDLNIPQWVVLPSDMVTDVLSMGMTAAEMKTEIDKMEVPLSLLQEMELFFGPNFRELRYAVRSSALGEDGEQFSFAGQYVTKLNVSYAGLENAIREVWASIYSEHVTSYKTKHGIHEHPGLAVIIQEMVASDISGVAFGQDPLTGERDTKVISSVYGVGEGLVSGELNADTYTVNQGKIESNIVEKEKAMLTTEEGEGLETIVLDKWQKSNGTLNEEQLMQLSELLDKLNEKTGLPQDVEFAYVGDQLYVLQTRPITTTKQKTNTDYLLWDNSNIVESYPGVTTPMTYSFINKMYAAVYKQLVGLMGVSTARGEAHNEVFQNTLGLVRGRVYYNLISWHKMLSMVPGYSINAGFMDTMMGVKEKFELGEEFKMTKALAWIQIIKMVFKMIFLQITLPRERRKFQNSLNKKLKYYYSLPLESMSVSQLISKYKIFETTLLKEWKVPLVNDFFSMIWFGLLKKQTGKMMPSEKNIRNDLLCGSDDIISVQPIHRTMALAQMITTDKIALRLFSEKSPENIWEELSVGVCSEVKESIDKYLEDFGERCVGELKLETRSYTQEPELFIRILKSYVMTGTAMRQPSSNIQNDLREAAEQKMSTLLKGKFLKRWWFNFVLGKARDLVSNRENLRYERTRAFGVVRRIFTEIGNKLHSQNIIDDSSDIFYLKLEELLNLEMNELDELTTVIKKRRGEFAAYESQPDPMERFYSYGYNFEDKYIYSKEKMEPVTGNLQGIGCCPGQIKAKVQVVMNPSEIDSLNGDILVTRSTDPGWVTLFPSASAIIVEKGSLLSHSAIVCREMGIPCIVSVEGLLRTLKTGDEIMMDGSTGIINLVNQK